MRKSLLSPTAPISPKEEGESSRTSVELRKISNGYIKTTCVDDHKGYSRVEEYCPSLPKEEAKPGSSTLSRAIQAMK